MAYILTEIYIYPIKSLSGIRLRQAQVYEKGLQYDRRWMLTDLEGQFLSQRTFPAMALLDVTLTETGLRVQHRRQPQPPLFIPFTPPATTPVEVSVWDDRCLALPVSQEADAWFSQALGRACRLVFMPEDATRRVDEKYVPEPFNTSLSDGYPVLAIGQTSLDHLNARLPQPVAIHRFRPNLVFSGGEPHEEDSWRHFRVGDVDLRGVKPCARCVMTTINPQTAEKGTEPLRTLATYRQQGRKILFGQNVVVLSGGTIREGDVIEVTERIA